MKLIVDLIYEGGLDRMRYSIPTRPSMATCTRGEAVVGDSTRQAMKKVLADIQSGEFAREWIAEYRSGNKKFNGFARSKSSSRLKRSAASCAP